MYVYQIVQILAVKIFGKLLVIAQAISHMAQYKIEIKNSYFTKAFVNVLYPLVHIILGTK